jgi:hypothetical protein
LFNPDFIKKNLQSVHGGVSHSISSFSSRVSFHGQSP